MLAAAPLDNSSELDKDIANISNTLDFSPVVVHAVRRQIRTHRDLGLDELDSLYQETIQNTQNYRGSDTLKMNAHVGSLRAAYASSISCREGLKEAVTAVASWTAMNVHRPSELEKIAGERVLLAQAKNDYFSANYDAALSKTTSLYAKSTLQDEGFLTEVVSLHSLLCSEFDYDRKMPQHVLPLSQHQILRGLHSADIAFTQGDHQRALEIYSQNCEMPCTHTQKIRGMIGTAKAKHRLGHEDALESWQKINKSMQDLKWSKGFAWGLVNLSLGVMISDQGDKEANQAPALIATALQVLREEHRPKWLPGGLEWVVWVSRKSVGS